MSKPTVAILGASADRSKFGNKSVRAHVRAGYDVYPVNPSQAGKELLDRKVYTRLADIPVAIDMVDIFRSSDAVPAVVDALGDAGCPAAVIGQVVPGIGEVRMGAGS